MNTIQIIKRDHIPSLTSIGSGAAQHHLGILKDFRKDALLSRFLPETSRTSFSWVHLDPREVLQPHVHPTASMIIMAHGEGLLLDGQAESKIDAGDVVIIPGGCAHGFRGAGALGYWALSIQFEGAGLYEDPEQPRVQFGEPPSSNYDQLIAANQRFRAQYTANDIFKFIQSDTVDSKGARGRLLDTILVWSNYFQRVVLARSAFTDDARYSAIFKAHLDEEYDHNTLLAKDRGSELVRVWDPVLDSTSSWFAWKMVTLDNLDKLVLVHLVLEAAATEWHRVAHPIMARFRETNHFESHDQVDHGNEDLGLELLRSIDASTLARLSTVQQEGWDMMNTMCARMAALASQMVA
ncbi:MAG TPA: cupin domain-containing protein [Kofleriaceae bacterium]